MRSMLVNGLYLAALLTLFIAPHAYGDSLPVTGSTVGVFSNPTGGSTLSSGVWRYSGSNGYVTFTPASFTGVTPQQLVFGTLTLTNTANGGAGTFGVDLGLTVNFSNPSGQSAVFSDTLRLIAVSGNSGVDKLIADDGGFPEPEQFTSSGTLYTVTYDGFFDSLGTPISELSVANRPGGSATAYLKGTVKSEPSITSSPSAVSTVPEPSSVALLGTTICGVIALLRRKSH